jgi:hypothetical protein
MLGLGMIHSHFVASSGTDGWYETVENNEVITFPLQLNTIQIEAGKDVALKIKYNNDPDIDNIDVECMGGLTGLPISRIQIMCPSGTKIRWKGLTSIDHT